MDGLLILENDDLLWFIIFGKLWFILENLIKMDDLGVPPSLEKPQITDVLRNKQMASPSYSARQGSLAAWLVCLLIFPFIAGYLWLGILS